MEGHGPARIESTPRISDSMLCEEQFAETSPSPGSFNGEKMQSSENYEHSFPFRPYSKEDNNTSRLPEHMDKDIPTRQPLHSLPPPRAVPLLPHEPNQYILPPIRPSPPPPKELTPAEKKERRQKNEEEREAAELNSSNDSGDEEMIEVMRENILLRKKNTLLMNQNMKLILELKDREHKIFRQQLLIARYRKRFIDTFENSDVLFPDSESEEEDDIVSSSEDEYAAPSPILHPAPTRPITDPLPSPTTTTSITNTPGAPVNNPYNNHNHNHNHNLSHSHHNHNSAHSIHNNHNMASPATPILPPLPSVIQTTPNHASNGTSPSPVISSVPHRSLAEQYGYTPMPHTPVMNSSSSSINTTPNNNSININNNTNNNHDVNGKRKRMSAGRGRGGALKRSRGSSLGPDGSPLQPQGNTDGAPEQGEAITTHKKRRAPRSDFMAVMRPKDGSGIYPLSPGEEHGGYLDGDTVISGFPVPLSLNERHRKGRKSTLWSAEDDEKFLKAYALYGKSWKLIHTLLPEKTREQVQSHGQYLIRTGKIDDIQKGRRGRKLLEKRLEGSA